MENDRKRSIALMVTREGMGTAAGALPQELLRKYALLLMENNTLPGAICFYADGVKLVVEGSPLLDVLHDLEEQGVHLIVCRTCLVHFDLEERVRVGIVGGMGDIIAAQWTAEKGITL